MNPSNLSNPSPVRPNSMLERAKKNYLKRRNCKISPAIKKIKRNINDASLLYGARWFFSDMRSWKMRKALLIPDETVESDTTVCGSQESQVALAEPRTTTNQLEMRDFNLLSKNPESNQSTSSTRLTYYKCELQETKDSSTETVFDSRSSNQDQTSNIQALTITVNPVTVDIDRRPLTEMNLPVFGPELLIAPEEDCDRDEHQFIEIDCDALRSQIYQISS